MGEPGIRPTPIGLLEYWQSTWFRLTETQQKSFLKRNEVGMLCAWPKIDVERNMKKEKKLLIVLDLLREEKQIDAQNLQKNKLAESFAATRVKEPSGTHHRCNQCENLYAIDEEHYCDSFA